MAGPSCGVRFDDASLSRTGGRAVNEDCAGSLHTADASCWVVADGLGGHRGGDVASNVVVQAALRAFEERPGVSADDVRRLIAHAQEALLAAQHREPSLSQMRTTIVLLLANAREAVWGHVGDSRLYYIQGGRLSTRTRDHSVTQALVDGGQLDEKEQGAHEDRNRLLRSLGKEGEPGVTIGGPVNLCRDDAFLLCTDGFWETLDATALTAAHADAEDAGAWLARLEARLHQRADAIKDNYTATAIRLVDPQAPAPP
jgi:serine/threonine protein phosphatase PrpC